MKEIPNVSLKLADLPASEDDWGKIGAFALTFNGYQHYGSFGACSEIAEYWHKAYTTEGTLPGTLTEMRACLFFEQRRWRHYGYHPDERAMKYIRALVSGIRTKVQQAQIDEDIK